MTRLMAYFFTGLCLIGACVCLLAPDKGDVTSGMRAKGAVSSLLVGVLFLRIGIRGKK